MVFENKNKWFLFVLGILGGLLISAPIILLDPVASPPMSYTTIITDQKTEYNRLYENYIGVTGFAIDGDVAIQIEFDLTESVYKNIGVILIGHNDTIIYALCAYNADKVTVYRNESAVINDWYEMENVETFQGVIVFYHQISDSVLAVSTWIW